MEEPERLTSCNSGRRRSSDSIHSPEFEFWMVRNPSFPQPNQLSADELFSHGVLLPLDLLQCPSTDDPSDPNASSHPFLSKTDPEPSGSGRPETESGLVEPEPSAAIVNSSAAAAGGSFTSSKRWKDIFKKTEKSNEENCKEKKKEKEKRKEKKLVGGSNGVTGAELNINIWPFSRSRSAGNGGSRPRVTGGSGLTTRKVSSAPCSRSNSAGESKSRKWPSSPSRGGVHLGRSSPVWQVRRNVNPGPGSRSSDNLVKTAEKALRKEVPQKESSTKKVVVKNEGVEGRRKVRSAAAGGGPKARVLNLNVPMCIGYRNQLGCRSDEHSTINSAAAPGVGSDQSDSSTVTGEGVRGSNLFNIKSLFTKKVY